jgi:tubulin polyglutamylase TTLL4
MLDQKDMNPNCVLSFKISDSTHTYNCMVNALKMAGFKLTTSTGWNLKWTGSVKVSNIKNLSKYMKMNHFPGCWSIGRKDNLWRNISKFKRLHGDAYNICPRTYIFPEDYKRLCLDREL